MLHGKMLHRQMLHGQMLHGQILLGQMLQGQILHCHGTGPIVNSQGWFHKLEMSSTVLSLGFGGEGGGVLTLCGPYPLWFSPFVVLTICGPYPLWSAPFVVCTVCVDKHGFKIYYSCGSGRVRSGRVVGWSGGWVVGWLDNLGIMLNSAPIGVGVGWGWG